MPVFHARMIRTRCNIDQPYYSTSYSTCSQPSHMLIIAHAREWLFGRQLIHGFRHFRLDRVGPNLLPQFFFSSQTHGNERGFFDFVHCHQRAWVIFNYWERCEGILRVRRRIGKKGKKGRGGRGSKRVCRVRYEEVLRVCRRTETNSSREGKRGERQ